MPDNYLIVIPARGGSKGVPGKNIKPLNGLPLLSYTTRFALKIAKPGNICLSTDSEEIAYIGRADGISVPFIRPAELATDEATTFDVLRHALRFYKDQGREFKAVIILQPTSPFRLMKHIAECIAIYSSEDDMVMSVTKTKANPYYLLMEEDKEGYLHKSKQADFSRRQDLPDVYEINGSIYICSTNSLMNLSSFSSFRKVRKYEMDRIYNIDIDDKLDWQIAEYFAANELIPFD